LYRSHSKKLVFLMAILVLSSVLPRHAHLLRAEDEKETFLYLLNQYRISQGRNPLKLSSPLTMAAQGHSLDMAMHNYFSHTSLDGRTFDQRIRDAGYTYQTYLGENIAAGFSTAESVFEAWKASSGHNENMLFEAFVVIGIGLAFNVSSTYGYYWTTDFGGYDDTGTPPLPPPEPGTSKPIKILTKVTLLDLPHEINMSEPFLVEGFASPSGTARMQMNLKSPSGRTSQIDLTADGEGHFQKSLRFDETGDWSIEVLNLGNGTHAPSGAFVSVRVQLFFLICVVSLYEDSLLVDGEPLRPGIHYFEWESGSTHVVKATSMVETEHGLMTLSGWSDGSKSSSMESRIEGITVIFPVYVPARVRVRPC